MHKCKGCSEMCSAAGDDIQRCAGCGMDIPASCHRFDELDDLCIKCADAYDEWHDEAYKEWLKQEEYHQYMMDIYREETGYYQ